MQIISGRLKGLRIVTSDKCDYRPTTARVKDAIFNILAHGCFGADGGCLLDDAVSIDLFAGTGALTFEALSRGGAHGVMIEKNPLHLQELKANSEKFGLRTQTTVIRGDATNLPKAKIKCNLAFIDPPFNLSLVDPTLVSLVKGGWLKHGAIIVIETHFKDLYSASDDFALVSSRQYGHAILRIYRFVGVENE